MDASLIPEYDAAAQWCAHHGLRGVVGDPLPPLISIAVVIAINDDIDAFTERVRASAYALAMAGVMSDEEDETK